MNSTSDLFESSAREAALRENNFSTTHRDDALAEETQTEKNLSTGGRRLGNDAELPFESQGNRTDLALDGLGLESLWEALGALDFEFGTASEYKSVGRWQESISAALLNSDDPMDLLDWGIRIFEQLSGRQITFAMFRDWLGPRLPDTTRSLLNTCRNRGSLQTTLVELLRASGRLMEIRNSVLTTIFQERQARTWAEFRSMLKRTFFKVFVLTIADQAPLALGTDVWTSWCFARLPEPIRVFLLHKIQVQQFTLAPLLSQAFSIHYLADTKSTAVAYPVLQPDPLPRGACHSCGKLGHKRAACPDKDATCESCGKRGHTETACIRTKLRGSMKALDAELKPTRTGFNLGFKTKLTDLDEMAAGYNYFNKRLQPTNRTTEVEMVPESGRSFVGVAATRRGRVQTIRGGIGRLGNPTMREIELTLDGGAEVSLISERIADEFADVIEPSTQDVYGVGGERQLDRLGGYRRQTRAGDFPRAARIEQGSGGVRRPIQA